jgi:hypothetical protein
MTRMADLQARRRALLARCAQQRVEIAQRIAVLRPYHSGPAGVGAQYAARHPLVWIAVLGVLLLMRRTRQVLTVLLFMRTAVGFATRAAQLLRLIGHSRAQRPSAAQEP